MSIHPPKHISSTEGLGLGTAKQLEFISETLAIGTETWGPLETPWAEGETVIAQEGYVWRTRWEAGKPYIITKFFDTTSNLVGIYCDISRPVRRTHDGFEFDDMYLDVWQTPGNAPVILDEDELVLALDAGYITQEEASAAKVAAQEVVSLVDKPHTLFNF